MRLNSMKKKLFTLVILFAAIAVDAFAWNVSKETLTYDIMYKWGLINKKAGSVTLKATPESSSMFKAKLTASTAPWADKYYMVRDTLKGEINSTSFIPSYYEKISHEGGDYNRDLLYYTHSGDTHTANATRWRLHKKDTEVIKTTQTYSATGLSMDMLSAYFYMRQISYQDMKAGDTVKFNVFSGSKKETLTIKYKGVVTLELNKKKYSAYRITFIFTTDGGKVSSDNMDAWISTTDSRIPLLLEGKLVVGKVRAVYSGAMPE